MRVPTVLLITIVALSSCRSNKPRTASEAATIMTEYGRQQNYDEAIRIGEDWLKNHPRIHPTKR